MRAPPLLHGTRVLIIDDDDLFRGIVAELLRGAGYAVAEAEDGESGLNAIDASRAAASPFDLMIIDLYMPGMDGLQVVEAVRRRGEGVPILMLSGMGTVDRAVAALHLGADDFAMKPLEPDALAQRVAALLALRPRPAASSTLTTTPLTGDAPAMRELLAAIRAVAGTESPVLLSGEPGTEAEAVARVVHELSGRAAGPCTVLSCSAIGERELERALSGQTRGRPGSFERSDGGTLFLRDVDALTPELQQTLVHLLQTGEVTRVGGTRGRPFDVRIVASTHHDLCGRVASGAFRADLLGLLSVLALTLPPLRRRASDIPALLAVALASVPLHATSHRGPRSCSPAAMKLLREYQWPGNVAELRAAVIGALIQAEGRQIQVQHLPTVIRSAGGVHEPIVAGVEPARYRRGDPNPSERAAIVSAMAAAGGIRSRAADLLGMGRTTLWRKLKEYGLVASGG
ncbi:MAG TPA: sigma-54 dependent transcriptional regulator [Gemmatimonadales bacterium]